MAEVKLLFCLPLLALLVFQFPLCSLFASCSHSPLCLTQIPFMEVLMMSCVAKTPGPEARSPGLLHETSDFKQL